MSAFNGTAAASEIDHLLKALDDHFASLPDDKVIAEARALHGIDGGIEVTKRILDGDHAKPAVAERKYRQGVFSAFRSKFSAALRVSMSRVRCSVSAIRRSVIPTGGNSNEVYPSFQASTFWHVPHFMVSACSRYDAIGEDVSETRGGLRRPSLIWRPFHRELRLSSQRAQSSHRSPSFGLIAFVNLVALIALSVSLSTHFFWRSSSDGISDFASVMRHDWDAALKSTIESKDVRLQHAEAIEAMQKRLTLLRRLDDEDESHVRQLLAATSHTLGDEDRPHVLQYAAEGKAYVYRANVRVERQSTARRSIYASHRTLPLRSMVRITNLRNGYSLNLRIDKRVHRDNSLIGVSPSVARLLKFHGPTARVYVQLVGLDIDGVASELSTLHPTERTVRALSPHTPYEAFGWSDMLHYGTKSD
jgi:rare lipoprotein A (peptidoglycan hydrolase)